MKINAIIDLSVPLENDMPVYPGDPTPDFKATRTLEEHGVLVTKMQLGTHTGSHMDAPLHFIEGGESIDELDLKKIVTEAIVLDLSNKEMGSAITIEDLEKFSDSIRKGDGVLLFTGTSKLWGDESILRNFTYIDPNAARWLVDKKVSIVGIDCLSVEKYNADAPETHKTLLSAGIPLIETLSSNLEKIAGERVLLIALPLKIKGRDAAPARVIAIRTE
ncbi:MAG: cyclase family protein [Candidatus Lokiarchaeota archaeon]|nr:cyclase family protein [Candidatus Lokiarchaeota archaeon]